MLIPYLVEGEILQVEPKATVLPGNIIRYKCRVVMPDGSQGIVPNVEAPALIGGIADYFNYRHRGSLEDNDLDRVPIKQNERDAAIGDRCLIAFVNGNMLNPKIIAFYQHPNQTPEILDPQTETPQAVLQLLGIRVEISDTGEIRFIHKGAPEVKYDPSNSALIDYNPLGKVQEAAAELGASNIKGNNNAQVVPQPDDEVTLWEILKGGLFRLRDSGGQAIELNREKGTVLLSNAYFPSILSTAAPTAAAITGKLGEYIEFDKNAGSLTIGASSLIEVTSLGDFKQTTTGGQTVSIIGKYAMDIKSGESRSVLGKIEVQTTGGYSLDSTTKIEMVGKTGFSAKDGIGGGIKIANGKVALGGPGAELVDILVQLLQQLSVEVYSGFGSPATGAAIYAQLATQLATIKGTL